MKQEKLNDLMPTDESKVVKYEDGFSWQDTIKKIYKDEPGSWRGVTRTSLIGGADEVPAPFHLRYFEVEVGGFSSHEKHAHQHIIVVVRGQAKVTLGDRQEVVSFGDVVYIAPWESPGATPRFSASYYFLLGSLLSPISLSARSKSQ